MPLKTLTKVFLIFCLSLGFVGKAFSTTEDDFNAQCQTDMQGISDFINSQFTKSMGLFSTLGWNDNPSVFDLVAGPHFEIGIGAGVDLIQVTNLNNLNLAVLQAAANVNLPAVLPIPFPAATARVGLANGLDVGLKFLYLPEIDLSEIGLSGYYTGVGVDFRYKFLEGARFPTLTVEVSYDQMQGNFQLGTSVNQTTFFSDNGSNPATITGSTNYSLNWNVRSFGAKLIAGKDLVFVYPYGGIGFQRNSGTVVSTITGQMSTSLTEVSTMTQESGSFNANSISNGIPVIFEAKYLLGLDFGSGEGIHCNLEGESNGSDLAASIGFKVSF